MQPPGEDDICYKNTIRTKIDTLIRDGAQERFTKDLVQKLQESNSISPYSFMPMETLQHPVDIDIEKEYQEAMRNIRSRCQFSIKEGPGSINNLLLTSTFMNNHLLPYLNSPKGSRCRLNAINTYNRLIFKGVCKSGTAPEQCERAKRSTVKTLKWFQRIKDLEEAIDYSEAICKIMSDDPFEKIEETLNELSSTLSCQTPKVGEGREYDGYTLLRTSNDEYEVKFNLNFSPKERQQFFEKFTRICLDDLNNLTSRQKMIGTSQVPNSPKIKFTLAKGNNVQSHNIKIMGEYFRSSSTQWEEDIDCETIGHEVMHLFGLQDCYYERDEDPDTGETKYPCRKIGRKDSLMSNHYKAFDRARSGDENILYADQVRMILYKGCRRGGPEVNNSKYLKCIESAYMSASNCEDREEVDCSGVNL